MALFFPTLYRRRITDVTAEDMRALGARGVLLDIDNTLTTHDAPELSADVSAWLERMQAAGLRLMVVSNNSEARVAPFAEKLGLPFYAKAGKPLPRGYRAAAERLGVPKGECAAIGDQIFTDIVGANVNGMASILLEPIEPETKQKFIVFKRRLERLLLRGRQKRRREADYAKQN